jgi:thiol-disulfide isomerase/thioredoxin
MKNLIKITTVLLIIITTAFFPRLAGAKIKKIMNPSTIKLKINYPEAPPGEQIALYISANTPGIASIESEDFTKYIATPDHNGICQFVINLSKAQEANGVYIVLQSIKDTVAGFQGAPSNDWLYTILDHYFLQAGDNLTAFVCRKITFGNSHSLSDNFDFKFAGVGSLKCALRHHIDSVRENNRAVHNFLKPDSTYDIGNRYNAMSGKLLLYLQSVSGKLNHQAEEELRAHAVFLMKRYESIDQEAFLCRKVEFASSKTRINISKTIDAADLKNWSKFDRSVLNNSYDFWIAQAAKYKSIAHIRSGSYSLDSMVSFLYTIRDKKIKETLLIYSLKQYAAVINNISEVLKLASKYILTPGGKCAMLELAVIQDGQAAYNFRLPDTSGKSIRLSDFKGKVVFVDFWYTGCGNCINYYSTVLSKVEEQLRSNPNVVFITISIDKNQNSWNQSIRGGRYTSTTAINLYTNGEGEKNDLIKFYNIHAYPCPMIIGKDQRIVGTGEPLRNEAKLLTMLNAAVRN